MAQTKEARKWDRIQSALYDVFMRVQNLRAQNLRAIEAVHQQFFVSIEGARQNNTRLGQAVGRTLTLATNTLLVGLAIQSALAQRSGSVTEQKEAASLEA